MRGNVHKDEGGIHMTPTLSVIVPVLNEEKGIGATLAFLAPLRARGVEVIVVDGGSQDGTVALATPLSDQLIISAKGRGRQLHAGAAVAHGSIFLFLHADTRLPDAADQLIFVSLGQSDGWGRFDVEIVGQHRMLRVVSAMMNLRSRWSGIATGDQAMFITRDLYERVGGFPDQPLMEDIEISQRLCRLARPICLRERVRTSGRRWERDGVWRTILLMWRLRWRNWRGEAAADLAKAYQ